MLSRPSRLVVCDDNLSTTQTTAYISFLFYDVEFFVTAQYQL